MFNLKNASTKMRKAAALQGIRTGTFEPIFDPTNGPSQQLAKVSNGRKTITITNGDVTYADHLTWKEISR